MKYGIQQQLDSAALDRAQRFHAALLQRLYDLQCGAAADHDSAVDVALAAMEEWAAPGRSRPASRIFTSRNAAGAAVYDVDTLQKLERVMSIDVDAGLVEIAYTPLRLVGDEVDTYTARYRAIHPIYAGLPMPVLFHCYSREGAL